MWLLLAGRALYTTGVALQASLLLGDSSSSSSSSSSGATAGTPRFEQPFYAAAQQQVSCTGSTEGLPQLWLPTLKDSILALGSHVQAASDGTAVHGYKQLRVLLGGTVFEAHTQLVAACQAVTAAADSTCSTAAELAVAAGQEDVDGTCGTAAHNLKQPVAVMAWQQLHSTGAGKGLADSLISFGSLLCAALPTRFCCNEPSCCCLAF
jgi:hypothetical protein